MAILKTKLKNQLQKHGEFEYCLSNIVVNGRKLGCSGFVRNPETGLVVYVNTEKPVLSSLKPTMVRYANVLQENETFEKCKFDYGIKSRNIFCNENELVPMITKMLSNTHCKELAS